MFNFTLTIMRQLSRSKRLEFAEHLIYDPRSPGLNERMSAALIWAATADVLPSLHDIMSYCEKNRGDQSLVDFAESYCHQKKYTRCDYEGTRDIPITRDLFQRYVKEIIELEIKDTKEEKSPEPVTNKLHEEYASFCNKNSKQVLDDTGLHHYFYDKETAQRFIDWLKRRSDLKKSLEEYPVELKFSYWDYSYYVSLSSQQFNIIMGENAFSRLLTEEKIAEYYQICNGLSADTEVWLIMFEKAELKEEFNQRRLLAKRDKISDRNLLAKISTNLECSDRVLKKILPLLNRNAISQAFLQQDNQGLTIIDTVQFFGGDPPFI